MGQRESSAVHPRAVKTPHLERNNPSTPVQAGDLLAGKQLCRKAAVGPG